MMSRLLVRPSLKQIAVGFAFVLSFIAISPAQADDEAIRAAALDYIEGWYTADVERMRRAVHSDLAKRNLLTDGHEPRLRNLTAQELVEAVRGGGGSSVPESERQISVQILDVFQDTASVRIGSRDFVDYVHLVKIEGQWKIINVLWERIGY